MSKEIKLGYELGSGRAAYIPLKHTAVIGETQASGKTTTLEALNVRLAEEYRMRAVAFVTKRGEKSFRLKADVPLFFREPANTPSTPLWQWVVTIVEAADCSVGKEELAALIEASDSVLEKESYATGKTVPAPPGSKKKRVPEHRTRLHPTRQAVETLEQVAGNVKLMLSTARGKVRTTLLVLNAYFDIVVPQIAKIRKRAGSGKLVLEPGINVMDLESLPDQMKMLVIRSVIEEVYLHHSNTIVIVPEAWKYIPQRRSTPVRLAAENYIREGLAIGNVLMIDSQDLANVATEVRKSIGVYILGKQGEINEVQRTVQTIPEIPRIAATEIMTLGIGEFYVVAEGKVRKVYVQPAGMDDPHAMAIAMGEEPASSWGGIVKQLDQQERREKVEVVLCPGEHLSKESLEAIRDAAPRLLQIQDEEPPEDEDDARNGRTPAVAPGIEAADDSGADRSAEHANMAQDAPQEFFHADAPRNGLGDDPAGNGHAGAAGSGEERTAIEISDGAETEEDVQRIEALEKICRDLESENRSLREQLKMPPRAESQPEMAREYNAARGSNGQGVAVGSSDGPLLSAAGEKRAAHPDLVYEHVRTRLLSDAKVLAALDLQRPQLEITISRPTIAWGGETIPGRIAQLIHEGFFVQAQPPIAVLKEFKKRSWASPKAAGRAQENIVKGLCSLGEMGFLTWEAGAYLANAAAKIRIKEA